MLHKGFLQSGVQRKHLKGAWRLGSQRLLNLGLSGVTFQPLYHLQDFKQVK